ncbi:MAG: hypothetical protein K8S98_09200 [Planctomycetes bacterium]|nr:hypothetical protein [Planctomycetota bacterium]
MNPRSRLLLSFVLCSVASCGGRLTAPPEVRDPREKEKTELVFQLARHDRLPDGTQLLSAAARLQGRPVGFDLVLGPWRENPPGYINMSTWESRASLRSQGAPSDELLRLLDELYATHSASPTMVEAVDVQALSPWKNPGDMVEGAAKFLLLFPVGLDGGEAGELWLEIDSDTARVVLREKEPRLRRRVLDALTAET